MARFEERVDLAGGVAVYVDLRKHRKAGTVFRSRELENFGVGPGLLRAKLVAGKGQDTETVRVIVKGTQTCVLSGEASTAGDVDHQTELTLELRQSDRLTCDGRGFEIVQTRHWHSFGWTSTVPEFGRSELPTCNFLGWQPIGHPGRA